MYQNSSEISQNQAAGFSRCLIPLLDALGWHGADRHLAEALPLMAEEMDRTEFFNTLANLKFESTTRKMRLSQIDERVLPCVFIPHNQPALVILKTQNKQFLVFDGGKGEFTQIQRSFIKGTAVFFQTVKSSAAELLTNQKNWFRKIMSRFFKLFVLAGAISLVLSVFSLISPLFVMFIYDQALNTNDGSTLFFIGLGVLIFIIGDYGFRSLRSRIFAYVSVRLGNIVGNEVLRRILYLPPEYTESATTGSQLSRIKDFESVQGFFSGRAVISLFDLPFLSVLLLGLVLIGGNLVIVPLVAMLLFSTFGIILRPFMLQSIESASVSSSKRMEYIIDLITNFKAIKLSGTSLVWKEKYRELSAQAALNTYSVAKITSIINSTSHFLVMSTGLATMIFGIFKVLDQEMSAGALMASILIVWRILAPLRTGFGVLTQVGKIRKSITQIDRLMRLKLEQKSQGILQLSKNYEGSIRFNQVSFRYTNDSNPALLGVSFETGTGEILVIAGHDGAGKSTICKLILGMYKPQAGNILADIMNIRQIDPILLRQNIAYVSQENMLFHGTIKSNLKLANPIATQEQIDSVLSRMGLTNEINQLEKGIETRLSYHNTGTFSKSFIKRLGIAQVLLKNSRLILIDEPELALGLNHLGSLITELKDIKSHSTAIVISNNPLFFEAADNILWLESGKIKQYGPATKVARKINEEKSKAII